MGNERYDFSYKMKNKDLNDVDQGYKLTNLAVDDRKKTYTRLPPKLRDVFYALTKFNRKYMSRVMHEAIDNWVYKRRKALKEIL